MNICANAQIGALFRVQRKKTIDESIVEETPFFENLVLDAGLDKMSNGTWVTMICVGSGNSEPNVAQTGLDAFVANTYITAPGGDSTTGDQLVTLPYYSFARRTYRFNPPASNQNLSEIGLGWATNALWNRTLIKDNLGNPTTVTWLNDEYLDVTVELRVYPTLESTGSFNLLDKFNNIISTHTYTVRPIFNGASFSGISAVTLSAGYGGTKVYSGGIGTSLTADPLGSSENLEASNNGNPTTRSIRAKSSLSLSQGNAFAHKSFKTAVGGIISNASGAGLKYKWEIDPPISKRSTQTMEYNFSLVWGRYSP